MILWLLIATIPATLAFFSGRGFFEGAYDYPVLVGGCLLGTGVILLLPKLVRAREQEFGLKHVIWMGVAQSLAILPGISRSGATISAGLLSGAQASRAAEFSFLMFVRVSERGQRNKEKHRNQEEGEGEGKEERERERERIHKASRAAES